MVRHPPLPSLIPWSARTVSKPTGYKYVPVFMFWRHHIRMLSVHLRGGCSGCLWPCNISVFNSKSSGILQMWPKSWSYSLSNGVPLWPLPLYLSYHFIVCYEVLPKAAIWLPVCLKHRISNANSLRRRSFLMVSIIWNGLWIHRNKPVAWNADCRLLTTYSDSYRKARAQHFSSPAKCRRTHQILNSLNSFVMTTSANLQY